ncbi:MAG: GNAT family N-acetyltransferase [Clostridia bacterium]|nr:GNAT family N-acetyltransferase [Clostridia bacterium]
MELTLEPIHEGDEERFRSIAGEEHVLRFLPDMEMTAAYASRLASHSRAAENFSPKEQMRLFGIYREKELVGALTLGPVYEAGYRVTVGFFLGKAWLGRGIAGKKKKKALELAKNDEIQEVCALAESENERSRKLLERIGFREETRLFTRRSGEREKRETVLYTYCL